MRWTLVLVLLVVAGAVAFLLLSGGERASGERAAEESAAEESAAEARARDARQALVAPTIAESGSAEKEPSSARAELPDYAPRVRGIVRVEDGGELGEEVSLQVDAYASPVARPVAMDVCVAVDGSFAFLPPPGTSFVMLELRAEWLFTPTEVRAVPGFEVVIVALRRAADVESLEDLVLSGVVRDQHGVPFADVTVFTADPESNARKSSKSTTTGEDGRFLLTGLTRESWEVVATSDQSFGQAHVDIDGTRGDVHGLELTLERGGCIEGRVRWPDGTPVMEFEAMARDGGMSRMTTCEGGSFRLCGLSLEKGWDIEIRAPEGDITGMAKVPDVRPGGPPLDIVLEAVTTFARLVSVQDEHGQDVPDFRVFASARDGRRATASGSGVVELAGLTAGEWQFTLLARGFEHLSQKIALAPEGPMLTFVLERAAMIRGTVVDARGVPVACADVEVLDTRDESRSDTDEQGRFEVAGKAGANVLRARLLGVGASELLEVTLARGQATDGVRLQLDEACRLEGRVLDAQGELVPETWLSVGRWNERALSDAAGAFTFACLPPGAFDVEAIEPTSGRRARASATLMRGQATSIELRFAPLDPVRLHGRATLGGKPPAGMISFRSATAFNAVKAESDGSFELVLASPGPWVCWCSEEGPRFHVLEFVLPDADEHELTLDFDSARELGSLLELGF